MSSTSSRFKKSSRSTATAAKGTSQKSLIRFGIRNEDINELPETFLVVSLESAPRLAGEIPVALREGANSSVNMSDRIRGDIAGTESSPESKGHGNVSEINSNTTYTEVDSTAPDPKVQFSELVPESKNHTSITEAGGSTATGTQVKVDEAAAKTNTKMQPGVIGTVKSLATDSGVKLVETGTTTDSLAQEPKVENDTQIRSGTTATEVKTINTASNAESKPIATENITEVKEITESELRHQSQTEEEQNNDFIEIDFSGYYRPGDEETKSMMLTHRDGVRGWTRESTYYKKLVSLQKTFEDEDQRREEAGYTMEKYLRTREIMKEHNKSRMDYLRDVTKTTIQKDGLNDYRYEIYITDKRHIGSLGDLTKKGYYRFELDEGKGTRSNQSQSQRSQIQSQTKMSNQAHLQGEERHDKSDKESDSGSWIQVEPQPELEMLPLPDRQKVQTRVLERN